MLDSDGWIPGRAVQWMLIGDSGAKKHSYAERLSKLLEVPHISMGSLVRQELNPRSTQAEIVDQIADIDLVVNFKCTNEHLVTKNLGTGNFSACREYLSMGNSVRNLNLQSKEELKSSPADAELTKSLEDYYRKQNKLIEFQVQAAPGETWQGLLAALHLQHINAVNSSQKLTARLRFICIFFVLFSLYAFREYKCIFKL